MSGTNGAIQVHQQAAVAMTPFEPQGLEQAMSLATTLAKSGLMPAALRGKPADILIVLMTGRELGIGPMQAIRSINVIDGKPVLAADLMVALCVRRREVCEFFRLVKSDDKAAEYVTKRAGSDPVTLAWTMAQAQQAGLAGKRNWQTHPAAMLRARCASALARAVYPDLVGNMYDPDEAEEFKPQRFAPPPAVEVLPPAEDVPQAPAPEEPPQDALDLAAAIQAAETMADLDALVPKIKAAPKETQDSLRPLYTARKKELAS